VCKKMPNEALVDDGRLSRRGRVSPVELATCYERRPQRLKVLRCDRVQTDHVRLTGLHLVPLESDVELHDTTAPGHDRRRAGRADLRQRVEALEQLSLQRR